MKYEYKLNKEGFITHKPCFWTRAMQTAQENMIIEGKRMKEIYMDEKQGKPIDQEEKELARWFINSIKSYLKSSEKKYNDTCVGEKECWMLEDIANL